MLQKYKLTLDVVEDCVVATERAPSECAFSSAREEQPRVELGKGCSGSYSVGEESAAGKAKEDKKTCRRIIKLTGSKSKSEPCDENVGCCCCCCCFFVFFVFVVFVLFFWLASFKIGELEVGVGVGGEVNYKLNIDPGSWKLWGGEGGGKASYFDILCLSFI